MPPPLRLKREPNEQPSPEPPIPMSDVFEKRWPTLYAWMTQDQWEDRTARMTTTILFFFERGVLKACVHDRDGGRSAFITGSDPEALLDLIEAGLDTDTVEWRKKRV